MDISDNISDSIEDKIMDNDLANIQSIKEEINIKTEKDKEKENLINKYLEGFDDEFTKNTSNEDKTSIDDIPDLIDDENEIDIPSVDNIKIEDKNPNVPRNKDINKDINKNKSNEKDENTDIPIKRNIKKEEKSQNKQSNTHIKHEKEKKSNLKPQRSTKFNSSKDDVSSKFEGNSKDKKTKSKDNSSNKKGILDGEFKVKENFAGSNKANNTPKENRNNGNTMAKSLMNRLRNIGDELVNNRQNNGSQNIDGSEKAQKSKKEQIKKSNEPQVEKTIPQKEENKPIEKKSIERERLKEEPVDLETNNIHDQTYENVNEFEEKESIISDDDIEYTTEENLEVDIKENIKEDNKEIFEEKVEDEIDEDIKGAPVYSFDEEDEDDDVIVYSLEDDIEDDIEDISEDIIQELNEEDLETNESEGIENMREYKAPRRKKDDEAFDIIIILMEKMEIIFLQSIMMNLKSFMRNLKIQSMK